MNIHSGYIRNCNLITGRFHLAGNIILSQGLELPPLSKPTRSPQKKVDFPERLREICLSLPGDKVFVLLGYG